MKVSEPPSIRHYQGRYSKRIYEAIYRELELLNGKSAEIRNHGDEAHFNVSSRLSIVLSHNGKYVRALVSTYDSLSSAVLDIFSIARLGRVPSFEEASLEEMAAGIGFARAIPETIQQ